ncbi:Ref family recombination enhancement nuclease [Pantoea eucrina]|uniref:Ref family recombination enhancement nuclease n=1 Tax=Pantoea eucrina TaxID=472693 RepID=UPI0024B7A007|nr:Ref family recombination enhancement nuclease [Pantoea eucrina]MDJ0023636.1 Ref family recombination enhancement nuclease [Pantoea eucrina]
MAFFIFHYQHTTSAHVRAKFPWLVPVHTEGIVGGKVEFGRHNGTESELLVKAYKITGIRLLDNA